MVITEDDSNKSAFLPSELFEPSPEASALTVVDEMLCVHTRAVSSDGITAAVTACVSGLPEVSTSLRYNRRPTCPDASVGGQIPTPPPSHHRKSHSLGNK